MMQKTTKRHINTVARELINCGANEIGNCGLPKRASNRQQRHHAARWARSYYEHKPDWDQSQKDRLVCALRKGGYMSKEAVVFESDELFDALDRWARRRSGDSVEETIHCAIWGGY